MKANRLLWLFTGFLMVMGITLVASFRTLPVFRSVDAPPFPDRVGGKKVLWIPDNKVRHLERKINIRDIESVELRGGGATGVPGLVTITSHRKIVLLVSALRTAVRLKTPYRKNWGRGPGVVGGPGPDDIPFDEFRIHVRINSPSSRSVEWNEAWFRFYNNVYEGAHPNMEGGAVSPEFQNAMWQIGIPERAPVNTSDRLAQTIKWSLPQ